jgi:hypothetical protein
LAALAAAEGHADDARRYWPLLTKWAGYLMETGYNPGSQLCTDDFGGHLASNTNLSIKAILGLAAYARLCEMTGQDGARYLDTARQWARQWTVDADDGDHYRLAFDRPETWSLKYNLVWDKLLNLNVFPPEVARREVAHYLKMNTAFGPPLDNRNTYTKLDWIVWAATLAERPADFLALIEPVAHWLSHTPSRVPMTDWYQTAGGAQVGFQARSVVGGVFIAMLREPDLWAKWRNRAAKSDSASSPDAAR